MQLCTEHKERCFVAAEPLYADDGELVGGGADLDIGGVASYCQDLIYISAGVQLLSATISDKFWWLFLSVSSQANLVITHDAHPALWLPALSTASRLLQPLTLIPLLTSGPWSSSWHGHAPLSNMH